MRFKLSYGQEARYQERKEEVVAEAAGQKKEAAAAAEAAAKAKAAEAEAEPAPTSFDDKNAEHDECRRNS